MVAYFYPIFIPFIQLLGTILDFGLRIADLLYRFALSFFIKLIRRRRTLNPNSKIQNLWGFKVGSIIKSSNAKKG
jgi:hypothetical protein